MKLLVVVDNHEWAMTKRAAAVLACMPGVEATTVPASEMKDKTPEEMRKYDLLWCTGHASFVKEPPGIPWVWTISCEGARLEPLLDKVPAWGWSASAILTQTFKSRLQVGQRTRGALPLLLVPHGVDTDRYSPHKVKPPTRLVGMAANVVDGEKAVHKGLPFAEGGCAAAKMDFALASCFPEDKRLTLKQMPDWYRTLWAYCQPSISEGGSNTLMEAMATGVPCLLCRNVGYHGEVCRDAREYPDGEVLFVERSVTSIKDTLIALKRDGDLYRRLRRNSRDFVKRHSWEDAATRLYDLFRYLTVKDPTQ